MFANSHTKTTETLDGDSNSWPPQKLPPPLQNFNIYYFQARSRGWSNHFQSNFSIPGAIEEKKNVTVNLSSLPNSGNLQHSPESLLCFNTGRTTINKNLNPSHM